MEGCHGLRISRFTGENVLMEGPSPDEAHGRTPPPRPPKEAPSDVAAIVDDDLEQLHQAEAAGELDPRRAYEVLEIRTPLEEFEGYVRARIDTLSRLGEQDKAELAAEALDLGRRALARVTGTGAPQPEKGAR
jgi:hypothetical protein